MSNHRRPGLWNTYRTSYLRSPAWFARRDRWFEEETATNWPLRCVACGQDASKRQLELHHLEYGPNLFTHGVWHADEPHEDLVAMHPYCHELLHRLIDRDQILSRHLSRRVASARAIARLRAKLTTLREAR
ncbi:MAG: hypothetical protein J0J05_12110 [Microbacterium sp.]|mgnify:CR=1 FL=1|uniref:hypothetical protein n=1 Tax=Microbacterium sp. TaxID=51671 RepID=UPI001AC7B6C8|nr:hypothetical protein [Microbacterium sp.]MBN9154716.1 hypothetical protein [Microbacterium sp.]